MILEAILNLVRLLLQFICALLPDIPDIEVSLLEDLTHYFDLIFDNLDLLPFFIDINTVQVLVPLVLIVINFEHIYHFAIWVLKKLPLGIS